MENSNLTAKVVGAVLVGTLIGATLGILFAPYKGSRTRNRIVRRSKDLTKDLSNSLKEEANVLLSKAEKLERLVKEKFHDLSNKLEGKMEAYQKESIKHETNNL